MKFINRLLIDFAYRLDTSLFYQRKRRFFYNILENNDYKYKKAFDMFMIILIFMSVFILIYDVKRTLPPLVDDFNNYVISIIFLIEYLLRFWISSSVTKAIIEQDEYSNLLDKDFNLSYVVSKIARDKLAYISSPKAIIDFFAIMPFFHELRLLRIFILFRFFKLFRYTKSLQIFASVLSTKKFEFFTLFSFAMIVVFVSSVLIYVMEGNNPNSHINTLYEAVYWSIVTISSVGYGDIAPVSEEGRFVAMFVIMVGIVVLAFTTSLFVSAFTEKLDEIREVKTVEQVSKIKKFYLICGYENIAREVTKKLLKNNFYVIVLDESSEHIKNAMEDGAVALNYNPGSVESYKKLNIDMKTQVKSILCLRENDIANVYTALTVRSINKEVYILSILMNSINKNKLVYAGINEILYEKELIGLIAREFVGQPVAFEVINAYRSEDNTIRIDEITITERIIENFAMIGKMDNVRYRVVILGIEKKSSARFFFNPIDGTHLEVGDILLVIGNYIFVQEFQKYLIKV